MLTEIYYENRYDSHYVFFRCNNEKNPHKQKWIKVIAYNFNKSFMTLSIRYYSDHKILDIGTETFRFVKGIFEKIDIYELMLSNNTKNKFLEITKETIKLIEFNKELLLKENIENKKVLIIHNELLEIFNNFLSELNGDNND